MKKQALFLYLLIFSGLQLIAQPFPLTISTNVNPPYTANYSSYFTSLNQISITVTNNSTSARSIYFAGSIATLDGEIYVRTNENQAWPGSALTIPAGSPGFPSTTTFTGQNLQPFVQNSNIEYGGITQQDIISGLLPEGDYQVCLRAFDYNTTEPLSPDEPGGCSNVFTISYPQPPQIIQPECGSAFSATIPQNILFNWQLPVGVPPTVPVRYRFTLVMLGAGIDAQSALDNPVDPVYTTTITTGTSLLYGPAQPALIQARTYAWHVKAEDASIPNPQIQFQNGGFSEPCTFTYLSVGSSGGISMVYPLSGDTLPWTDIPFISRFDPYSNDYTGHNRTFTLFRNGAQIDRFERDMNWPEGPELSQEDVLGLNITQEASQHINLYKRIDNVPAPVHLEHGNNYSYESDVEVENSAGSNLNGSVSGSFTSGMGRPNLLNPPNNDTVLIDVEVGLRFQTANPPVTLVPPMSIMQTSRSTSGPAFFNGGINERWKFELSRSESFTTTLLTASERVGAGLDYLSGLCSETCLQEALYKEETKNYTPSDTGWYYWRVCWLQDAADESSASYRCSPVSKFYVADSVRTQRDTVPETPGACVNTCDGPEIPASERVPVSTAAVGADVSIGLFTMRITEIAWSGAAATGKGTIRVPFMRAPMKVLFSGIRINATNRVYQGEVRGEYDNFTIIPSGISEGVAHLTSLDETQAQNLNSFVNSAGRLVSQFATDVPMGLPIGLDQTIDDQRITIGVVGLKFTPETAKLNAMISVDIPQAHGWLSLGATDVCFHPDGIGGDGRGMLYMPLDHDIPFSDSITLRFNKTTFNADYSAVVDSGTFVSWDCQGFRSLAIDGAVIFGRDMLVEDRADGTEGTAQIKAEFTAKVRRRSQWLARLNFNHPFQVKGVPGWGFEVEEAWLDFADSENPVGFRFPQGYAFDPALYNPGGAEVSEEEARLYWKGFYLKRQSIRIPPEFKTYSSPSNRLSFAVNDMLIDRRGLSASFRVENLFEVTDGNLNGWGFSMDTLMVDVVQNSFSRGGFVGEVKTPVSDSALAYSSMIRQNLVTRNFRYDLRIQPKDTINADLWAAKLALAPTSYIQASIDSSGIFARAELTGNIDIDAQLDGIGRVNFRFMEFEELGFQTRAPYIDCADCMHMGFASPQKFIGGSDNTEETLTGGDSNSGGLSGFPVSIENIGLTIRDGVGGPRAGIVFTLALNLTGENNTFSAATTLAVMGKLNLGGGSQQAWEFDGVDLDSIGISGSVGVVELAGGLRFYNGDMTYGNGFKGMIRATFKPTLSMQVIAQFGEKSGFRYWMVDAQVVFTPGITLMAGLDVFGFGGGAWYHMRRTTPLPSAASLNTESSDGNGPPGLTLTGVTFVPDQTIGFGFEATVIFGSTGNGQAYNADVSFGAEFSESGGITQMYLEGNGYFMCDIKERTNPQIHAAVRIAYDFTHDIFDARFAVTVNVAGGLLKGVNPGGVAGQVQIYASPETWFVHAGTPTTPIGLDLLGLFQTRSYLMVGLNLPAAPPPPSNVLSVITPSTVYRHPGLETGDGFAFGSRMDFNTGRLGLPPFYARLQMGMGFDISLMNYGDDVFCEGAAPGETIGIDGWYANGQIYAYLGMDIGIYVDLWFTSGEFSIINANMAALLHGGLPNPTWMQGTCGGNYSILNGLVRGNCQFEFKVGQECRPAPESPIAGIDILQDLVPYNGELNVECGTNPEASFNAEVEQVFDLNEVLVDGSLRLRRFRFVIERFELKKGDALIQTTRTIASDKFKASLVPGAFLDPYTFYTVSIKVRGEEYNFSTSTWGQAYKRDGSIISKVKSNTFKTGAYPDRIPESNIAFSYPFNTQRHFLQGECRSGLVRMKQSMDPLFTTSPTPTTRRKFTVRFIPIDGGQEHNVALVYNSTTISFDIPELLNNKVYACQLISKDSIISSLGGLAGSLGANASSMMFGSGLSSQLASINAAQFSTLAQSFSTIAGGGQVRSNRINGRSVRKNEKLLYVFFFKTSQHNTLVEKMQAQSPGTTGKESFGTIDWLEPIYTGGEKFDVFDVTGYTYMFGETPMKVKPLVYFTDSRSDTWNTTYTQPIIYDLYQMFRTGGYSTLRLLRPTPDTVGIPPFRTVRFHEDYAYRSPLAPSEFLPLSSSPNLVFGNLNLITSQTIVGMSFGGPFGAFAGAIPAPSTVYLDVETGFRTFVDYQRMVTIGNNVIGRVGHPQYSEFYTIPVRNKFIQFLNSGWRPMMRGQYEVNYYYRTPLLLCDTLDNFTPINNRKSYTY